STRKFPELPCDFLSRRGWPRLPLALPVPDWQPETGQAPSLQGDRGTLDHTGICLAWGGFRGILTQRSSTARVISRTPPFLCFKTNSNPRTASSRFPCHPRPTIRKCSGKE